MIPWYIAAWMAFSGSVLVGTVVYVVMSARSNWRRMYMQRSLDMVVQAAFKEREMWLGMIACYDPEGAAKFRRRQQGWPL